MRKMVTSPPRKRGPRNLFVWIPALGNISEDSCPNRCFWGAFAGMTDINNCLLTLLFLALPLLTFAQPPASETALSQANLLYKQGRYAEAAAAYQSLFQANQDNAYLHYNLGNAYFKQGAPDSLGHAIAEYWRAYRLRPMDADIRYNLDFALKRSGESLTPAGVPYTLDLLFHFLSEKEILGLQWIGYWLALLLAAAYLSLESRRDQIRPWLAGAALFWGCFALWWGVKRLTDISNPGVILENNAEARSGPGTNFPVSFNAPEGRRVSILSESGDWLELGVLKEGLRGWVPAKTVERI